MDHEISRLPESRHVIDQTPFGPKIREITYTSTERAELLRSGNYVPQNMTTQPYSLNNFPAAPSSLEKTEK